MTFVWKKIDNNIFSHRQRRHLLSRRRRSGVFRVVLHVTLGFSRAVVSAALESRKFYKFLFLACFVLNLPRHI